MTDRLIDLDLTLAHRHFAAGCFNATWALIDKPARTDDDNRLMLATCYASIYHWTQRPDCTAKNLSIGYWQLSRVHALLGEGAAATAAGDVCLTNSRELEPFYLGYAHEALARAAVASDNTELRDSHVAAARQLAATIADPDWRAALERDLDSI